jgi:hypothetical protein
MSPKFYLYLIQATNEVQMSYHININYISWQERVDLHLHAPYLPSWDAVYVQGIRQTNLLLKPLLNQ